MTRECDVLRVFTRGEAGGNHLGVIDDLAGLDTDSMQQIAADLAYSETTFVSRDEDGVFSVRIFTPEVELPFAGHPLVGVAWALAGAHPGEIDRLRCGVGDVEVTVDEDVVWISARLDQRVRDLAGSPFAENSGLPSADRVWVVEMPNEYLLYRTDGTESVGAATPRMDALGPFFGTYLFARENGAVRARFFAPGAGVPEDPATGSAAVALAAALRHSGESSGQLVIRQGEEIGYPSLIRLQWEAESVRFGGTVTRDGVRRLDR